MLVSDEMFESQDETHILHPSSRALFRYWETIRAERPAPSRADLDPGKIRSLVPNLFIAEYAAMARMFRWRLAGTAICEIYGRELTGSNMLAGWDGFETNIISRFLNATMTGRQPSVLRFRLQTDREQLIGTELMAFPLLAADGVTTHIFGGLFAFRETFSLGHSGLTHFQLSSARSVWTENLKAAVGPQAKSPAATQRNFRLISGGRT